MLGIQCWAINQPPAFARHIGRALLSPHLVTPGSAQPINTLSTHNEDCSPPCSGMRWAGGSKGNASARRSFTASATAWRHVRSSSRDRNCAYPLGARRLGTVISAAPQHLKPAAQRGPVNIASPRGRLPPRDESRRCGVQRVTTRAVYTSQRNTIETLGTLRLLACWQQWTFGAWCTA